jgi:hypothetical protein
MAAVRAPEPIRDLASCFDGAELTTCLLWRKGSCINALSVLRFQSSMGGERFRWLTRPLSLKASDYKLLLTRSQLTRDEGVVLAQAGNTFRDPAAGAEGEDIESPGEWIGAELVGEGESSSLRNCLPPMAGAFWFDEHWRAQSLTADLDERTTNHLIALVRKHLGLRLDRSVERIGNVVVVWPEMRIRASIRGHRDDARLLLVDIRTTTALDRKDLVVAAKLRRDSDVITGVEVPVDPVLTRVEFPQNVSDWEIEIYHRASGDLLYRATGSLMRHIVGNVNMIGTNYTFDFRFENPDGTIEETVKVEGAWGTTQRFDVGGRSPAERHRDRLTLAESIARMSNEYQLFVYRGGDEERGRAVGDLRRLIHALSRGYLKIWDPYFSDKDVARFLTAVADPTLQIQVLTAMKLPPSEKKESREHEDPAKPRTPAQYRKERFVRFLQTIRQPAPRTSGLTGLRVRLASSHAHDRFIITDGRCWQLGASFNQIGAVISTVVEVPAATAIEMEFDSVWKRAGETSELART